MWGYDNVFQAYERVVRGRDSAGHNIKAGAGYLVSYQSVVEGLLIYEGPSGTLN